MQVHEPYPFLRATVVVVVGTLVVAGIEVGKVCRRLVARLKEASK